MTRPVDVPRQIRGRHLDMEAASLMVELSRFAADAIPSVLTVAGDSIIAPTIVRSCCSATPASGVRVRFAALTC